MSSPDADRLPSQTDPLPAHSGTIQLPPSVSPLIGTVLFSPISAGGAAPLPPSAPVCVPGYEILGELGRGGMGVVYKARQLKVNRLVALKMILSGSHAGSVELARFHTEAEAIARLQHPNIVQVHDVGEHEGRPFFSLEFCAGGSLERKLSGTPLPPTEAARVVEVLARAMEAAHQRGVLHRDLKPANVLLLEDGTPKITDFGLARKIDEAGQTASGAILGTPSYMSPEQAGGQTRELGPACDVYALGAILYDCLTGRPPFRAATALDTILQVVKEEPVPLRRLNAQVPADLETICLKCLQKEHSKRYASAEALADDLRRFLAGEPITARPVGCLERGWRWCRRNPALAASLTAAVLLLVAGAIGGTVLSLLAERRADEAAEARGHAEREAKTAKAAKADLEKANAAQRESLDRLEQSAARSLLRPLGLKTPEARKLLALTEPEIDSLWELSTTAEERLRLRFVEEALRSPMTTRQLANSAPFTLHAAVGLDTRRRDAVERLLLERLSDRDVSHEQAADVALALAALGDIGPQTARQAGAVLLLQIKRRKWYDAAQGFALARGLAAVARHLDPGEATATLREGLAPGGGMEAHRTALMAAAAVVGRLEPQEATAALIKGMSGTTDPREFGAWSQGLSAALGRLEPREAIAILIQALSRPAGDRTTQAFALELTAVAARLSPREAKEEAAGFVQALGKTADPVEVFAWSQGLAAVAPCLDPGEAAANSARAASAIVAALLDAVGKPVKGNVVPMLTQALTTVAPHLEPRQASEVSAVLLRAMNSTRDPALLRVLSKGLTAVSARLEPGESAATLLQALGTTTQYWALQELSHGLEEAAPRLAPQEAKESAAAVLQAMNKAPRPETLPALATGLAAMAGRLEWKESVVLCTNAAATLRQAMQKADYFALQGLSQGLVAVTTGLEPRDAVAACTPAAERLLHAIRRSKDPATLTALAQGLGALAARLRPEEAAATCFRAAEVLLQNLTKPDPHIHASFHLPQGLAALAIRVEPREGSAILLRAMSTKNAPALRVLAQGLAAVAGRLDRKEAAAACAQAAAVLLQVMSETKYDEGMRSLAEGVTAVVPHLDSREATAVCARVAATFIQAMSRTFPFNTLEGLSPRLAGILQAEDVSAVRRRTVALAASIGMSLAETNRAGSLAALHVALGPAPGYLSTQDLIDLLKHPLCIGEARHVLLDQLEHHYQRQFADTWEFVRFARQAKLDLDFSTPPQRPTLLGDKK